VDNILVTMSNDLREFLFGIAVVQAYQLEMATGMFNMQNATRTSRGQYMFTFRMHERFSFFEPCLRVVKENVPVYDYSGWRERARREYDCFLDFDQDFDRAKSIALKLGQNIVDGFSILYGCGAKPNPVLNALRLQREKTDSIQVLIQRWDDTESEKFYEYLQRNHPEIELTLDPRDISSFPVKDIVNYVNYFDVVIGQCGIVPYLAASLNKAVFEFFPSNEEGILYGSKKPLYNGITGTINASWLWMLWSQSWQKISETLSISRSPVEPMVKEERQSIVGDAVG
jgi:hypothetical protein